MRITRLMSVVLGVLMTPLLARAQCVPVAGSSWPVLYSQIGYYTDNNPTISGVASEAASTWTNAIQTNSSADNNYAYSGMGIVSGGNQISVSLVPPIPGAWAITTYHPGQTPAYVVQMGEDTFQ
jgi:hypothetical protein